MDVNESTSVGVLMAVIVTSTYVINTYCQILFSLCDSEACVSFCYRLVCVYCPLS